MRIRSIKPEFWRSDDVNGLPWRIVYDGEIPRRVNGIAPMSAKCEYVYLLFDDLDQLLYVGRSFRPADRFSKHCRRTWWRMVSGVVMVAVDDDPPVGIRRINWTPPNVQAFEVAAIKRLDPLHNIAGKELLHGAHQDG